MTIAKYDYFNNSLKELAQFWKKELPPLVVRIYLKQLLILGQEEFDQAIELWLFSGNSFPSPEDLLTKVNKSPTQKALEQWKLLQNHGQINQLTHKINQKLKIRTELRTIACLPPKEYNYHEEALKKAFLDEYKKGWLNALSSGNLAEVEQIFLEVEEKKDESEYVPITAEDWARIKNQLKNIGIKFGKEDVNRSGQS